IYNIIATNCGTPQATAGCYLVGVGPTGYAYMPYMTNFNSGNIAREGLLNLHFGLPHKNDAGRDDIQVLFNTSLNRGNFRSSQADYGAVLPYVLSGSAPFNGTVYTQQCGGAVTDNCVVLGPVSPHYIDESRYTGPMGTVLTSGDLNSVVQYFSPNSPTNRQVAGLQPANRNDTQDIRSSIFKLQYQKNIGSNAYLRLYGYTFYTDWMNGNGTLSTLVSQNSGGFTGFNSPGYELISHERGGALNFSDQLNAEHLLNFTAAYNEASTVRWNNRYYSAGTYPRNVALLVDSTNPTDGLCYRVNAGTGTSTPTYCGGSPSAYRLPAIGAVAAPLAPAHATDPTVATAGAFTCGGGPCEYFTVENGTNGAYNNVHPAFSQASLQDEFRPNEKWVVDLAAKYERFRYNLADTTVPAGPLPSAPSAAARLLFDNSYNLFTCASTPALHTATPNSCAAGDQAQFSSASPNDFTYSYVSPRFGATYTMNPQNVLRFSAGLYVQPVSTAYTQYNFAQNNIASAFATLFYSQGYHNPSRDVRPEKSANYDFSWEHQVRGSDVQWKVTPFYRHTQDEINQVLLDPLTNFVSAVNVGEKKVTGIELLLRKGDFNRDGLSAQLAYTYTHGMIRFKPLPSGATALSGINSSIQTYNAYTSYCAAHATDSRCGTTTTGATAAACYTQSGTPDPACAAGDFANPYWNAPVQSLYDTGAWYTPYNQLPGAGLGAVSSSYIIPHVATLVLNYKHQRFTVTPTVQLAMGGKYGAPTNGSGIDPNGGCGVLAGSTTGDPRYPYGAAGGAPFDAQFCPFSIVAPDQFTHHFDNFGEFTEPSQIVANIQLAYEASKNVTVRLNAINVYNKCFGGSKEPWTISGAAGCWYGSPLFNIGNGYNPGNSIDYFAGFPYSAAIGNVFQSNYGGQANPFNAFLSVDLKL
ncbi:MAG: TonB-dependent receptor, partial [Candidatus Eremiobacteraeota bacterium]|nr:TonB-dependent receptor [Candidatus Eremiobacteraeota bacterium]